MLSRRPVGAIQSACEKVPAMTRVALLLIGAIVVLVVLSGAPGAGAEKRAIAPAGIKPVGPYSPGIMAGDFLYVSGQGMRPAANTTPESAEDKVRQCLRNVQSVVEAAGLTMEHVVYAQVYLHSSMSYDVLGKVWKEFF